MRDASTVSPRDFCAHFKNWDDEPVDVRAQQDASEFLSNLFTQVERLALAPGDGAVAAPEAEEAAPTAASRLERAFGGVFAHELVSVRDPAGNSSRRDEPFYMLSVQVKDRRRLEDALEAFVSPELVDYSWRDGGRREKTSKRASIKRCPNLCGNQIFNPTSISLVDFHAGPNHLLLHLKRFEFDLTTLSQRKINSRFEFPAVLDLAPYVWRGDAQRTPSRPDAAAAAAPPPLDLGAPAVKRGDEGYDSDADDADRDARDRDRVGRGEPVLYDLGGVVVHSGNCNSGHYYSFVREQGGDWFEFNDAHVAPFDARDLGAECFGGAEPRAPGAGLDQLRPFANGGPQLQRERTRNAFLLVYHRRGSKQAPEAAAARRDGDGAHRGAARALGRPRAAAADRARPHEPRERGPAPRAAAFDEGAVALRRGSSSTACGRARSATRAAPRSPPRGSAASSACARSRARTDESAALLARCASALATALAGGGESAAARCSATSGPRRGPRPRAAPGRGAPRRRRAGVALRRLRRRARRVGRRAGVRGRAASSAPSATPPPAPRRRGADYERCAARAACDVLALVCRSSAGAGAALARLEVGDESGLEATRTAVDAIAAGVAEAAGDDPFRTGADDGKVSVPSAHSLRKLLDAAPFLGGAFAPKAEALALLLERAAPDDAKKALDALTGAQVAALAYGAASLLDRGRHSRRGSDEQRRRSAAARAGTARPDESSDSDDGRGPPGAEPPPRYYGAGRALRRAWRALGVVLRVDDGLRHWRATKGLGRAVAVAEHAFERGAKEGKVRAAVEELLKLCKRDAKARDWARTHAHACAWLETWASGHGPPPDRPDAARGAGALGLPPRRRRRGGGGRRRAPGPTASATATRRPSPARPWAPSAPSRAPRALASHRATPPPPDDGRRDGAAARRRRRRLPRRPPARRRRARGAARSSRTCSTACGRSRNRRRARPSPSRARAYDSDDDPNVLVGRRVEVRWAGGTFYSGVISNFDDLGHHVCYDDGDSRVYSDILAKTFRLL
ncbi:23S rRNA (adenine(1618)-N(6))-methyltransferase [Aureococcus anophagefferens]|nr:23S rRNA (adenine(1618)-N(6))-methyltransferase [Aureococcus anophagefferens]